MHAQNAQTSCAKYTNVMLKMQKHYAQNLEKCYAPNAEMLCSKCGNVTLKLQKSYAYAQKQISVIRCTVRG